MKHNHQFVEEYKGLIGFGMDRKTNENTLACYLQKFSDDQLLKEILPRMSDDELEEVFDLLDRLMKAHFSEPDYHRLFLKE